MDVGRVSAQIDGLIERRLRSAPPGDNFEYESPEGAITSPFLERLKAHKADLMRVCDNTETVVEEVGLPGEIARMQSNPDPQAHKLLATGGKPKERGRLLTWENPETGIYCSQEVALRLLGPRDGANARIFATQESARAMDSGKGVSKGGSGCH